MSSSINNMKINLFAFIFCIYSYIFTSNIYQPLCHVLCVFPPSLPCTTLNASSCCFFSHDTHLPCIYNIIQHVRKVYSFHLYICNLFVAEILKRGSPYLLEVLALVERWICNQNFQDIPACALVNASRN